MDFVSVFNKKPPRRLREEAVICNAHRPERSHLATLLALLYPVFLIGHTTTRGD